MHIFEGLRLACGNKEGDLHSIQSGSLLSQINAHYAVSKPTADHGRVKTETAIVFALPFSRKLHFLGESLLMTGLKDSWRSKGSIAQVRTTF